MLTAPHHVLSEQCKERWPVSSLHHREGQCFCPLHKEPPSRGSQYKISHDSYLITSVTTRNLLPLMSKNLGDFSNKVRKKAARSRDSQGRAIQTETSSGRQETAMPRTTGLEDLEG